MEVGPSFEDYMDELEEAQRNSEQDDTERSEARRKLMEHVTVQIAQYNLLAGKNERFVETKKNFKFYPIPRLYRVRPVMPEKMMVDLIEKNKALLEEVTELVGKNEAIATMEEEFGS